MKPRVIVFDFGNVIAHFDPRRAAENLAVFSPLDGETILARVFGSALEFALDSGQISPATFRDELREVIEATHGTDAELDFAFSDMFTRNDAICDVLPALVERGFRLLLLSNTNAPHAERFAQQFAGDLARFEHLVLSHEVGARKPDQRIYDACQARAGCSPEEILFVDDRADNIVAAQTRGWNVVHYHPFHGLPAPLRGLLNERTL